MTPAGAQEMGAASRNHGRVDDIRFVIITGMSGAGKTLALRALSDLGYFCVDNLPAALLPTFADLCRQSQGRVRRLALVIDARGGEFFAGVFPALANLEEAGFPYTILFLEADDETLVRRFKEARLRHPLAPQGSLLEGIREERARLEELRGRAHRIIDTSRLSPARFREELVQLFGGDQGFTGLLINVVSFGYKHGLPLDADLVFDVRFLPNPHYVDSLRPLDGTRREVIEYIFRWPQTRNFMRRLYAMVEFLLPHYITEGKSQLCVAIGCTGGRHRSVAVANRLAGRLRGRGYAVIVSHRDMDRDPEAVAQAEVEGADEEARGSRRRVP